METRTSVAYFPSRNSLNTVKCGQLHKSSSTRCREKTPARLHQKPNHFYLDWCFLSKKRSCPDWTNIFSTFCLQARKALDLTFFPLVSNHVYFCYCTVRGVVLEKLATSTKVWWHQGTHWAHMSTMGLPSRWFQPTTWADTLTAGCSLLLGCTQCVAVRVVVCVLQKLADHETGKLTKKIAASLTNILALKISTLSFAGCQHESVRESYWKKLTGLCSLLSICSILMMNFTGNCMDQHQHARISMVFAEYLQQQGETYAIATIGRINSFSVS